MQNRKISLAHCHTNKERATMLCAVYLILEKDGMVLLQQRKGSGFYDGYYGLPSGHWEHGETVTQAMQREANEEININMELDDLEEKLVTFIYNNPLAYVGVWFTLKQYSGEIKINEPTKCSDLRFFRYDALPDNIIPYIKEALHEIKSGTRFLEMTM